MGTDYDAFLSYSKHDQTWVETHLIPRLQAAGIKYLDYQQFQLGAPKLNEIERAVLSSRMKVLIVSPSYLLENWQGFENLLANTYDLEQGTWSTIPLIIEACDLPLRFKAFTSLDLISPTEQDWNRLLSALQQTTHPTTQQTLQRSRPKLFYGVPLLPQHFIGREEILHNMINRLTSSESISLSTDGQGGIGKTTLAIALARHPDVWAHFPDGVLWAGLGKNADKMSALAAWGEALGQDLSSLTSIEDRRSRIEHLMGNRRMLLVIDDAWELDAANAMKCGGENCAYLLTTRDKILATRFAGRGQVETLSTLTDDSSWNILQTLAPDACAADLNAARALANAGGGLPLAIELLGGYLAAQEGELFPDMFVDLSKEALAELTDPRRRLQLVTQRLGSKGGKLTFEQILSLSLEDLPEEAQRAFYSLGAFAPKPATFSREAAEYVVQTNGKTLALFTTRNLLEIVETRFMLHQSLTDLAHLNMLQESQVRHREFYLSLVYENRHNWRSIEREIKQIWHGWEQNVKDETKIDWIWVLTDYMDRRGLWGEYIKFSEIALSLIIDRKLNGVILNNLGSFNNKLGKHSQALNYYKQALTIFEEIGDIENVAGTINNIGLLHAENRQSKEALNYFARTLSIFKNLEKLDGIATTLSNIGLAYKNLGQPDKALEHYEQALPIIEELGNQRNLAKILNNIAVVYRVLGQRIKALEYYQLILPIRIEVGDRLGESITRYNMSKLYYLDGKLFEAVQELRNAVELEHLLEHPDLERDIAKLHELEAELAASEGKNDQE